jgi:hypothetical protein
MESVGAAPAMVDEISSRLGRHGILAVWKQSTTMFRMPSGSCDSHRRKPRGARCLARLTELPEGIAAIRWSARRSCTGHSASCGRGAYEAAVTLGSLEERTLRRRADRDRSRFSRLRISINWIDPDDGARYCFSSGTSLEFFLDDPQASIARARAGWLKLNR